MILVVSHRDTHRINKKKIFDTVLYFFLSLKRCYYIKRKDMEMKDFNFEKVVKRRVNHYSPFSYSEIMFSNSWAWFRVYSPILVRHRAVR